MGHNVQNVLQDTLETCHSVILFVIQLIKHVFCVRTSRIATFAKMVQFVQFVSHNFISILQIVSVFLSQPTNLASHVPSLPIVWLVPMGQFVLLASPDSSSISFRVFLLIIKSTKLAQHAIASSSAFSALTARPAHSVIKALFWTRYQSNAFHAFFPALSAQLHLTHARTAHRANFTALTPPPTRAHHALLCWKTAWNAIWQVLNVINATQQIFIMTQCKKNVYHAFLHAWIANRQLNVSHVRVTCMLSFNQTFHVRVALP